MTTWGPEPISEDVRRELARFGPAGAIGDVVEVWPEAVGPAIAENAWPARIARDGTLHVAANSSAWAFELTQLEEKIRERLRGHLGDTAPRRIKFAAGRLPERGGENAEGLRREPREPGPNERAMGAEIAAPIEDPELRQQVARAAAASLSR